MTGGGSTSPRFHLKGDVVESDGFSFPSRGNFLRRAEAGVGDVSFARIWRFCGNAEKLLESKTVAGKKLLEFSSD